MKTLRLILGLVLAVVRLFMDEHRRGTLHETLRLTRQRRRLTLAHEFSHADLLEDRAKMNKDRAFLRFHGQTISYNQMNANANRLANFLHTLGAGPGQALAIMMKNSPRWLDAFFGAQRLGMCSVPVNIALRGNQLAHIFNHSEAKFACIDHDLLTFFDKIKDKLISPPGIIVNTQGAPPEFRLIEGQVSMDGAYGPETSTEKPAVSPREGDPCLLMYTSGTTGLPKGVPSRFGRTNVKTMSVLSRALLNRDDIYYTCLPLFHANALMLTVTNALNADAQVALSEKFSASRFWDDVRSSGATTFNTLGAMITILMKQPEKPTDREHKVHTVLSAACPTDMWEPFEKRFGVHIIEGYGAVDTGSFIILNYGQAPFGSMGKPLIGKHRLVDDDMKDVPVGKPGELIFFVGESKEKAVEYYKDEKATTSKLRDGWLHTEDLVYTDKKGYLYFVGRKTESIRRRGENISAYEVEHAILQYPDALESAVYAVPSEMGENEVMAAIVPLEGKSFDPKKLAEFLKDHLAKFAIPRYYRILPELPKTETQRVIKDILQKEGVTKDTIDLGKDERKP